MRDAIMCRGSFRYATDAELQEALGDAREHLADFDDETRFLREHAGSVLVDAALPLTADRHVAAAVLASLARRAVEGHVEVTIGDRLVDAFVCESGPH